MDRAVAERLGERVVDEPVLVEEREPREARRRDGDLEVVAAARPVLDAQLARIRKRRYQQLLEPFHSHGAMLAGANQTPFRSYTGVHLHHAPGYTGATYAPDVDELGLFPLGIVLLPGEQVPLHIFEPRYRELIGECIEADGDFGILYADEGGVREVGTRARVTHVLERFDDGRLNIVVTGGERFRVERLTRGRSFMTAVVEAIDDDRQDPDPAAATRAVEAFRAVAAAAGAEEVEIDADAPQLSFELAAHVELPPDGKQRLVESTSENVRLGIVVELLNEARRALLDLHELAERAKRNGSRL